MTPKLRILKPSVNTATLEDGRGGIFTYFPEIGQIAEWSYIVTHKGTDRGHHHHPEFDEYIMFVDGHGCYTEKYGDEEFVHLVGPGDCLYIPKDSNHTFKPLEDCKLIALLTKKWDDCDIPIVRD
tara:strand:- start:1444 stop:1818 length:375 start_codon:yes stop_codon:yes gene_type:complete